MPPRRDDTQLKVEAARQLKCKRAGGWTDAQVEHVCGNAGALEVTFRRGAHRFFARLLQGEIVELEAFRQKKPSKK